MTAVPPPGPSITDVSPLAFTHGGSFQVFTPDAASISSVVLVRPGAQTHAFDMDQRLVGVSFTAASGVLNVTAPPEWQHRAARLLHAVCAEFRRRAVGRDVRASGARFAQPGARRQPSPAPRPTSPSIPDSQCPFAGTGSDPDGTIASYSWTFPGGAPASSSVANPGNVTYSIPGTYVASFRVTDNGGLTSTAATRTVTVPDFSLTASPSTQTVLPGGSTSYTATVTGGAGFTGAVNFSVTGLPSGATASFAPASVTGSGSTTLSVTTSGTTPAGTYTLALTGTSGPVSHTVNVTLVVNGDFSISVAPASVTIARGAAATYNVTIAAGTGFSGSVTLSASGLPRFATAKFTPVSVVNAGTSVLTVSTKKNVASGTYTLTVTGTAGNRVHSASVTLVVR